MSLLIRNGRLEDDNFNYVDDELPLPSTGHVIVSLARCQLESASLLASGLNIGVQIPNTCSIDEVWPLLQNRPLIALNFPSFGDGRAYSQARVLRDRFRFKGEIRAMGAAVVRDQMQSMVRCGIDSFLLRDDQNPQLCIDAIEDFTSAYQPAADALTPVMVYRRAD